MAATTSTDYPSLPDLFRDAARRHADLPALLFPDRSVSYRELDALSDKAAAGLKNRGIRHGDRVALYCINSDIFPAAYFGILKCGATVVPINLLLNPLEIGYIMADSGAKALIYHALFTEQVTKFRRTTPACELFVAVGNAHSAPSDIAWSDLVNNSGEIEPAGFNTREEIASIIYTSGTTGKPKGAMLTHANLAANTASAHAALQMEAGHDRVLTVLPMFHAFAATACMLTPLRYGSAIVPLPKFEPELVASTIEAVSATIFMGVPSMYTSLLHLHADRTTAFRSLRHCISGGAALPVEVMNRFEEKFGKKIYEGDGPTECSPVTSVNPIGGERKPASIGRCVPGVEMKIVDEVGKELPNGEVGEICVRGDNVMKGYWNQPEATRESFFGEWFRTGDLGTRDDDDYFFIVDRKKDMIIVNGMNVYPRMVEEVLYRHPAVREAAVVGRPHKLHGEVPVAFVSLSKPADQSELRRFCVENLGRHQIPKSFTILPELPKNAAGKIVKRQLRMEGEQERGVDHRG